MARTLTDGGDAADKAALVKDLGTRFEAESVELAADIGGRSFDAKLGRRRVPEQFDAQLWRNLEDTGLTRLTSTPELGAGPHELAIVLYGVARCAGTVPLAETDAPAC